MKRAFIVALLFAAPAFGESRNWSDRAGKHHVTAALVEVQNGIAYLQEDDGKIVHIPVAKLSSADRDFLKATAPEVKAITGKVVGVTDGDTITVLEGKTQYKIRLEGIDAPESHQAYGTKSRQALAHKVFQKDVRVEWRELDKYGRTLGHVFADDRWINKDMVQEGWAWHYRQYSKSDVLADAESVARTAKAGLWTDPNPTPPWEFRHPPTPVAPLVSKPAPPSPKPAVTKPPVEETVYVTNTGEKYHRAGCQYLKYSKIEMPLSKAAAGHAPCSVCRPPAAPGEQRSVAAKSAVPAADRDSHDEDVTGHTATGIPIHAGPRGGQYHYSKSGKKVYERKR